MSSKLCLIQDICPHFTNGTKRKAHHIRLSDPCLRWVGADCEKITLLAELSYWLTGEVIACNIEKIARLKKKQEV